MGAPRNHGRRNGNGKSHQTVPTPRRVPNPPVHQGQPHLPNSKPPHPVQVVEMSTFQLLNVVTDTEGNHYTVVATAATLCGISGLPISVECDVVRRLGIEWAELGPMMENGILEKVDTVAGADYVFTNDLDLAGARAALTTIRYFEAADAYAGIKGRWSVF